MPTKTASLVSVILSILLLVVFAVLTLFFEMVALNGASERQGMTAMGITLLCQAAGAVLLGSLAWKSTSLLVTRFNLNSALSVVITVILAILAGGLFSFLALVVSIPLAGIR
ncbi:MAG TPA: hypothetical protein VHO49_07470 [Anaerolineales bacterium]|nr:hypothetical protein [Anaerolineales bacterium]